LETLRAAYSIAKQNDGAPGIDGETFELIAMKFPLMRSEPLAPSKSPVPLIMVWTSASSPSPTVRKAAAAVDALPPGTEIPPFHPDLVAEVAWLSGGLVLVFVAALLILGGLSRLIGLPPAPPHLLGGGLVALAFLWSEGGRGSSSLGARTRQPALLASAVILVVIALSILLARHMPDVSVDGQTYHQTATILLARHWNPLWSVLTVADSPNQLWINHYPQGAWLPAAMLYALTGDIEVGKVFNTLLTFAAFSLSLCALLRENLHPIVAGWSALIMSVNPVAVSQSLSFYADGQLASVLTCLVALALLARAGRRRAVVLFAITLLILINLKFTGVIYAGTFGLGLVALLAIHRPRRELGTVLALVGGGALIGVALVGFHPYVTNAIRQGHPFHPVAGPRAVDFLTDNTPAGFNGRNRIDKLVRSVFSASANEWPPERARPKWPLSVSGSEMHVFGAPDVRVGGFGPLFALGLVGAILVVIVGVWRADPQVRAGALAAGFLFLSVMIHPEAWWARYAPQLWLVPVIVAVSAQRRRSAAVLRGAGMAVLGVLSVNAAVVAWGYTAGQLDMRARLEAQREALARASHVEVQFGLFEANRERLRSWGIAFREVPTLSCDRPVGLVASRARFCVTEGGMTPRGSGSN
jgi:hypothetical protein